jgi:serine protease Do
MRAFRTVLLLWLFLNNPVGVRAEDSSRAEQVKALLETIQRAIQRANPSVATVLVSRSDDYRTAPYWGESTVIDSTGHLGRFEVRAAVARVPATARRRERIVADIHAHDLSNPRVAPESFGSGFVVGPDLILTNAHVVKNATKVYVRLPGENRGSWADIHASDPRSDLAVLRLLDPVPDLTPIKLGKGEAVKIGQVVLAMVNPWAPGFRDAQPSASWGFVKRQRLRPSSKSPDTIDERSRTLHDHGTLFQIDARILSGCSGGVLLNLDGQAVGLTTASVGVLDPDNGGALAVPFDANTRRIIEVLMRGEEVEYGFLGVRLDRRDTRAQISDVVLGSPAERAGLQAHDVILRINDDVIASSDDLFLSIGMSLTNSDARLVVARGGGAKRTLTVTARLAKFYVAGPIIAAKQPPAKGGLRVDYTSVRAQRRREETPGGPPEGVIVREVIAESPADRAGLRPDKVITHVNGVAVTTPAEYYREIEKARDRVELTVLLSEGKPERVTLDLK